MDIPIYKASEADNAITEGAFEIADFRTFIRTIVENGLFDREKLDGLLADVLQNGTATLSADELQLLHSYISRFNATCQRCGEPFSWNDMDPFNEALYCSNCRSELAESGS